MGINKDKKLTTSTTKLRAKAEEQLCEKSAKQQLPRTIDESHKLVHELEVHRIELEMQNEELSRAQEILESSRNKYAELYDFAPVGYFTFDKTGKIQEVNLAGALLLETERGSLIKKPFTAFIDEAGSRELFLTHLALVLQRQVLLKCEISLRRKDGSVIYAQLQSISMNVKSKDDFILTSIVDGTVRRQLEQIQQNDNDRLENIVRERTEKLTRTNAQLTQEIAERKQAEASLQRAYAEIKNIKSRLKAENTYLQEEIDRQYNYGDIIGQSSVISQIFSQVEQVAPMNATVLILGETGTGKGMIARAIHSCSTRKAKPLITVDCTTLPAALVESELFGRERGAYTGSDARQIGRFELADGGTIFLDEIGEMPLELQSKLLRVIQDGEFERLGSPRTIKTDVRIIAATNRNLGEEVKNGKFREDLFYRLNVFPITMPPLRQRKEDIPLLVNHFVAKFNSKIGKKIETVSKSTLDSLQEYHWPGNVRELESVIERAVITSQGTALQVLDRFDSFKMADEPRDKGIKALVDLEHDHILQVLKKTGWRIEGKNGAAILLGLNSSTLRARMRKYGIARNNSE